MSTTATPTFTLKEAHAPRVDQLNDELRKHLASHMILAHALRTKRADASATTLETWEIDYQRSFADVATALDEIRRLNDAADWIALNAQHVRVEA